MGRSKKRLRSTDLLQQQPELGRGLDIAELKPLQI